MKIGSIGYLCIARVTGDTYAFKRYCESRWCARCICRKLFLSGIEVGDTYLMSGAVLLLLDEEEVYDINGKGL